MKEFLVDSVFFGAVISLIAYEVGLLLKKRFWRFRPGKLRRRLRRSLQAKSA